MIVKNALQMRSRTEEGEIEVKGARMINKNKNEVKSRMHTELGVHYASGEKRESSRIDSITLSISSRALQ